MSAVVLHIYPDGIGETRCRCGAQLDPEFPLQAFDGDSKQWLCPACWASEWRLEVADVLALNNLLFVATTTGIPAAVARELSEAIERITADVGA